MNEFTIKWNKTAEVEPKKHQRVLCVIYGTDYLIVEDGETLEECFDRNQREMKRVEIGFFDSDGWTTDDGFPMIIDPTLWAELPDAPEWDGIQTETKSDSKANLTKEVFEKIWEDEEDDDH